MPYFLEGGQAVNFWAEYYTSSERLPELKHFQPFTSKDCDIWAGYSVLPYLEKEKVRGAFQKGDSPADGQVGVFIIRGLPVRTVDIMSGVYGIPASKLKRLRQRSLSFSQVRVIDPLFLFQSKCHCLMGLAQSDRQDEKHLRMLIVILPEYLRELVAEARDRRITQRAFINELKLLRQILRDGFVRQALGKTGS